MKRKISLPTIFRHGILLNSWDKTINTGKRTQRFKRGTEHLLYHRGRYYTIFMSEEDIIQQRHSKRLVPKEQIGELSYRGAEILKFEGKLNLIGDGLV